MRKTILVTGGDGLVGSAIRSISHNSIFDTVFVRHSDCDLTNRLEVRGVFDEHRPDYVIHTAARVGGIAKNLETPAQQFFDNIMMNTHVIDEAHRHGVKKLIAFSSVCAFPDVPVMTEDVLHDGPPFPAHAAYAYTKRMVDVQIESYRKQYDSNYCALIPGNIFGEHDNYDIAHGHVVPSLIHKAYLAVRSNQPLEIWGDGSPRREFIYVGDLARVCVNLLSIDRLPQRLIVSGDEMSIQQVAETLASVFNVSLTWNVNKPNGQLRRQTKSKYFESMFPNFEKTPIADALRKTANWFIDHYEEARK